MLSFNNYELLATHVAKISLSPCGHNPIFTKIGPIPRPNITPRGTDRAPIAVASAVSFSPNQVVASFEGAFIKNGCEREMKN